MKTEFKYYNHLGFFNPFFFKRNEEIIISPTFGDIVNKRSTENTLDVAAFTSIFTSGFAMGNRTLIEGIEKTPWLSKLEQNRWSGFTDIKFGNKILDRKEIASTLFRLLRTEILDYVKGSSSIGILLTGGMDSRMVAGALDSLIADKELQGVRVLAMTWGNLDSRDVVYAKEISKRLKWEWKHFQVDGDQLINNIKETAIRGAEYAPNHLHAMLKIREERNIDCILAASFGDSIGRGEYSGRTVLNLRDIRYKLKNKYGFLMFSPERQFSSIFTQDLDQYWKKFPQKKQYQQVEQDYQIHYMRRMLNPCLSVINEKIPLFQAFSAPALVQFMWSLDPSVRDNSVYKVLFQHFRTDLSDIPWARTGLKYDDFHGSGDRFTKTHTDYSKIIKTEVLPTIENNVLSGSIAKLDLLNEKALKNAFKLMKAKNYTADFNVEQIMLWLASFSIFLDKYQVQNSADFEKYGFFKKSFNASLFSYRNKLTHIRTIQQKYF